MADLNHSYSLPENREHPLVRGEYAIPTAPIFEMFDAICLWIDSHAPGGYIYGFSRYGKTHASRFWILKLLAERYGKALACFRLIYKQHDHFSESLFLSELLGTSGHKHPRGISKKIMLDRLSRHFAISARNHGGHQILLLVDEAQNMHEPEYQTLCNLENELEQMGFKLTVISVGSHELTYQHQVFVQTGKIHLMARYTLRSARFRGIRDRDELRLILEAYDSLTEWPEGSGRSFTKFFFPQAFEDGYRMAGHADELWKIFVELGPYKRGYRLEVPMEHIAKSVEYLFRTFSDESVATKWIEPSSLLRAVNTSEYENHMAAISYMLKEEIRAAS